MRAAFVASVAALSLACFAAAETAFYQDAAFLELVCPAANVARIVMPQELRRMTRTNYQATYDRADVMTLLCAGEVQSIPRPSFRW